MPARFQEAISPEACAIVTTYEDLYYPQRTRTPAQRENLKQKILENQRQNVPATLKDLQESPECDRYMAGERKSLG